MPINEIVCSITSRLSFSHDTFLRHTTTHYCQIISIGPSPRNDRSRCQRC